MSLSEYKGFVKSAHNEDKYGCRAKLKAPPAACDPPATDEL